MKNFIVNFRSEFSRNRRSKNISKMSNTVNVQNGAYYELEWKVGHSKDLKTFLERQEESSEKAYGNSEKMQKNYFEVKRGVKVNSEVTKKTILK